MQPLARTASIPKWFFLLLIVGYFGMTGSLLAEAKEITLSVMSFNLRYSSTNMPNAWSIRRPVMRDCLRRAAPDIMGTQEGVYPQILDVAADLSGYDWIGTGREGGSRGEFAAVFYRRARLEPVAYDHFWLSDTPSLIASATWGNKVVRMATMVEFRERRTGIRFCVLNVHFDHQSQTSRERSSLLLRERILALKDTMPVLLIGDFNADPPENRAYQILLENEFMRDLWFTALVRHNEGLDTFHDFKGPRSNGYHIDWILGRGPWQPQEAEILTFSHRGQYPSDHFPVRVRVKLTVGSEPAGGS